jgi:predicted dehydrogenase
MSERKIRRIGIIGIGSHGGRYAKHILEDFGDLELTAVSRRDAEHLEAAVRCYGAAGFSDYRDVIDPTLVDALIGVVPPHLNLDIVTRAAAAGLPLLLEKPAATSLAEGRAMLEILAARPIPVMVAQTLRYNGVVRGIMKLRERLGSITSISLTQRFEPSPHLWLDDPDRSGGGMILHTGVHSFDLLRYLSGLEATSVAAQAARMQTRRTEDGCAAAVVLGGGRALATVCLARTAGGRTGGIEVVGREGSLVGDHIHNHLHFIRGRTAEPVEVDNVPTIRELLGDFIAAVEAGREMPISLSDGLRSIAVVDACVRAAESGVTTVVEALIPPGG